MKVTLYELFFINDHIVPQIVKSKLVVCHISNVTGISFPALVAFHAV